MVAGSFYIPKVNDEKPLGEDASFICVKEQTIGVADGVGGWAKKGIDSGVYSRELMKTPNLQFNCPYQLGNASSSDDPSVAEKISVPVVAGDVIVLGTDGLFGNVHDFELEMLVNSGVDSLESDVPEILAWRIALYALDNAKSTELYTPFSRECSKVGIEHHGGKYDDITVVVANIC
ncbi:putative uric acid degradation bifunctional protein TTL-like isoform X1 [Capsicum annuum]|nr:putative uric acid degradation bifunctional protein TTL-like isoform X1 [Capsicum annuum]